tara:strand:+ start:12510 stop:13313 length:804 start_codon:yes stop_codon:yes gene_type:complete
MLHPRIIPCLLIHKKGLVKTKKFNNSTYIGDPLNAVKIFNEKFVDELIVLDIDATVNSKEPDYDLISKLATECRMPLCYGGGITNKNQVIRILKLGVEKVAISSLAINNPELVKEISSLVGRQSIVAVLDIKKKKFSNNYNIYLSNGKKNTNLNVFEYSKYLEKMGIGEIVINSIDNDGMMNGFNIELAIELKKILKIPLTILGGAGSLHDIGEAIERLGIVGVAAGSTFVFKGKYNAVLINYPSANDKEELINQMYNKYETNNSKH